jgi:hypothetical protein
MTYHRNYPTEERQGPYCQATCCFERASFYVVLKETELPNYYEVPQRKTDIEISKLSSQNLRLPRESSMGFDGFKMIMYFCKRHENDFKYLIKGSELRIAKECRLHVPKIMR